MASGRKLCLPLSPEPKQRRLVQAILRSTSLAPHCGSKAAVRIVNAKDVRFSQKSMKRRFQDKRHADMLRASGTISTCFLFVRHDSMISRHLSWSRAKLARLLFHPVQDGRSLEVGEGFGM